MVSKLSGDSTCLISCECRKSSLPPDRVLRRLRKEDWLHFSLLNHSSSILKKRVVVIGSMTPWVETLCLALGADSVTTLEVYSIYFLLMM